MNRKLNVLWTLPLFVACGGVGFTGLEEQDSGAQPELELDSGREPVPGLGSGGKPEPASGTDSGDEPAPGVGSGGKPGHEPKPEPDSGLRDSEVYWDFNQDFVSNTDWKCTAIALPDNTTATYHEDVHTEGALRCEVFGEYAPALGAWVLLIGGGAPKEKVFEYEGLRFWACGEGTIRLDLVTGQPVPHNYGKYFTLTSTWQEYALTWDELASMGEEFDFRPEKATGLNFWLKHPILPEVSSKRLWIDDLVFSSSDAPLGTSNRPCSAENVAEKP